MDATYYGPAEAAKFWHGEIDKWESVVKAAGTAAIASCAGHRRSAVSASPAILSAAR